ncbi:unnamed protein product [Cyclocybe aegerita]|uniref:Uncharacterized protein n=1 Tax=Cyclocybe aegerita TaxID=1973307 RepID=A0A8S0VQ16_CYCAE|nr:unnamed protein product [Cyclocybe aegerita]
MAATRPRAYMRNSIEDKESPSMHTSPTLTMSNSASNSSNSPPEPTTPPPPRRSRYPDLGRVPLHRRGTSKTYERLEDLLKEAGYKETRIFTPETERAEGNEGSGDKRNSVVEGVGAVVGFLTGLMPGGTGSRTHLPSTAEESAQYTTSPLEYSPPVSPLVQRRPPRSATTRTSFDATEPPTPTNLTSSIDSLADPTPKAIRHQASGYAQQRPSLAHRTSSQLSHTSSRVQKQPSRASLDRSDTSTIVSPRPSRAGAYLRHMASRASVQSVPPRPNSTPVGLFTRPKLLITDGDSEGPPSTLSRQGNGEGEDAEPPLPPSWLESVARAVLFGGTGAYIGGPSNHPSLEQRPLRTTRSSLSQKRHPKSRSGPSDQTNHLIIPPPLLSRLERGRSRGSVGEVSLTQVVCRSAPGSRSGSLVRDDGKERLRGRGRRRTETDRVPSLARTQVEGDVWSSARRKSGNRNHASASSNENRDLGGWGGDTESGDDHTGPGTTSEEDDDDGELDLARILVPPKRQNSIKSLRKHLASEALAGSGAHATLVKLAGGAGSRAGRLGWGTGAAASSSHVNPRFDHGYEAPSSARRLKSPMDDDWDGDEGQGWGSGWMKKRAGEGSDDDDASFAGFFGEGREPFESGRSRRSATGKSRLGFNGAWGLMGGAGGGS